MLNIFFLGLIISSLCQIQHTPIEPQVIQVKIKPQYQTIPSKHVFQAQYIDLGYQISAKIYQSNKQMDNEIELYNISNYNESQSCDFYSSELSLQQVFSLDPPKGYIIQTYHILHQKQIIVLVLNKKLQQIQDSVSSRLIKVYKFDQKSITAQDFNISSTRLGFNSDPEKKILINRVQNKVLFTNGMQVKALDINTYQSWDVLIDDSANKLSANKNSVLLQFQYTSLDEIKQTIKLAMLWESALVFFECNLLLTDCILKTSINPPNSKSYASAVIDKNYYALVQKQMIIGRLQKDGSFLTDFVDLQSQQCWQLNKQQSTIHMICKQGQINYVAELYYNQNFVKPEQALKLNRYYTQIDDARILFRFGDQNNPKLLIAGDYDILMAPFAINRKILIDNDNEQTFSKLKSLDIEDIEYISSLSTFKSSFSIGISQNKIQSFKIIQQPSSIECTFEAREGQNAKRNILVAINSTNCLANGDIQQLQSICQTFLPYELSQSLFQIDSSKQLTANLFVYVILLILGVFIVGCAFHCKNIIAKGTAQIKKKISDLKRNRQMKRI